MVKDIPRFLKQISYTLFIANIQFWLFIFVYTSFIVYKNNPDVLYLKVLLAIEPVLLTLVFYGFVHEQKILYSLGLILTLSNAILSVLDQIGTVDLISLALSVSLFLCLLTQFRLFYKH